ncbi:MAG: histidine phosphatase family protein [Propionibacteriaceae bacterium]|jgi:probable phosphoglycerate mutase|nr:histidine phosphatase family protein [Propionibacteriaceae bacterium]
MRLILIRHGHTSSNARFLLDTAVPGADLDEVGQAEAARLVGRLADYQVQAIFASVLVRTQQTAAPLAAALGLPVTVLPGLREISAGDDEMSDDATNYFNTLIAWRDGDLSKRVPGGESAQEFIGRYDRAIAEVAASGADTAAAFSHGAALRVWSWARIEGFDAAIGEGVLENTGLIVADGDPNSGWKLAKLDGYRTKSGYIIEGERR